MIDTKMIDLNDSKYFKAPSSSYYEYLKKYMTINTEFKISEKHLENIIYQLPNSLVLFNHIESMGIRR